MNTVFNVLAFISFLPVLAFFIDAYKKGNAAMGIVHILLFIGFVAAGLILLSLFKMKFVYSVPPLILIYVAICHSQNPKIKR
ncbi:MAG: hypothetical protein MRY83_12135 [Flavobacteriales bacterium]|nr:hypothetical protein [Flavobacteriales bacterium]